MRIMRYIFLCGIMLIVSIRICCAARYPDFTKNPAFVVSSSYSMLGTRDIQFQWGNEKIWLSEIFQSWGRKGTALLWKKLNSDEEKLHLVQNFGNDKDGIRYYFDQPIAQAMENLLKKAVNWVSLKEQDVSKYMPEKALEALKSINTFIPLPEIIMDVNITGLKLYKEYAHILTLFYEDAAGLKEIACRIASLAFIKNNPVMQNATDASISVIVESLIKTIITGVDPKTLSPLGQTAVKFSNDILKNIIRDPSFNTYEKNAVRLSNYYYRVMDDEIKLIAKEMKQMAVLDEQIRAKAREFSDLISQHTVLMNTYEEEAKNIHTAFIERATQYRALNITGKIPLLPSLHEHKEALRAVSIKADKLHAQSIEAIENVLAPGDAASARRLLKQMEQPLNDIYSLLHEVTLEIDMLAQGTGEILTIKKELELLNWKFKNYKKECITYYDFFHRIILFEGRPSFDAGDLSAPLQGRHGIPPEAYHCAYSYKQILDRCREAHDLVNIFKHVQNLIETYPQKELESPTQRNEIDEAIALIKTIQVEYIDNKFFDALIKQMRDELDLSGVNEDDLLDLVRSRSNDIDPAFVETIDGEGIVPIRQ